jgi:tripartite-type tricarboxylate transporter receptor subunit TctC
MKRPHWRALLAKLTRHAWVLGLVAVLGNTHGQTASPKAWPEKPLTLVSPFAAGGTSDAVARALARQLEGDLRQPVVVVNRPGAGGTLGIASAAGATPDGHTLVLGGLGSVVFPAVVHQQRIKYDPRRDLVPVGLVGVAPTLVLARAGLPANTLGELVALAKARPGTLSYASAGVGGTLHVAGVLLDRDARLALNHVPYKGGAPAMSDLAGGMVDLAFADLTLAQPFLRSGKVKVVAQASARRSAALSDVPTTAEAGFPNVRVDTWYAVFAPAGTPDRALDRLTQAMDRARASPVLAQELQAQSILPSTKSLAEFRDMLHRDFETWLPLLRQVCGQTRCE